MSELLKTGFVLMATGMGTVFALLATLVLVIHVVSRAGRWLAPATPAPTAGRAGPSAGTAAADSEIAIVIGAAVSAYRSGAKRKERHK